MGVIYRPQCGDLSDAMEKVKVFDSFEDLREYIARKFSDNHYIKLNPEEVVASGKPLYDNRIGWIDSDYLCIDSYEKVEDKEGFEYFFGGKSNVPQCIGYFATRWNRDQPNGIFKNDITIVVPN